MPADLRLDSKKAKAQYDLKDIRFTSEEELERVTGGVKRGGVTPFGNLFGVKVIVDKRLHELEKIVFNAGDRRFSVGMKSEDYVRLVNPDVVDITVE